MHSLPINLGHRWMPRPYIPVQHWSIIYSPAVYGGVFRVGMDVSDDRYLPSSESASTFLSLEAYGDPTEPRLVVDSEQCNVADLRDVLVA